MPPPGSIVVILNVSAGKGSAESHSEQKLREALATAGVTADIVVLEPGQNPADAARKASAQAAIVVAAGGDGTVSGVAAGILDSRAALGVLPLGTLNHFAKDLGIPLALPEAVAVLAAGHIDQVDAARVNDRVFVNNVSIGVYPDIVVAREDLRRHGHSKWIAMAIAMVRVLGRSSRVTVNISVDGHARTWRTPFVVVANNEYAIDGLGLGARGSLNAGKLFVYLSPRSRVRDLPLLMATALVGRAARSGAFEIVSASQVQVDTRTGGRIRVAIDGEVTSMTTPLRCDACPGALRVVRPRT